MSQHHWFIEYNIMFLHQNKHSLLLEHIHDCMNQCISGLFYDFQILKFMFDLFSLRGLHYINKKLLDIFITFQRQTYWSTMVLACNEIK